MLTKEKISRVGCTTMGRSVGTMSRKETSISKEIIATIQAYKHDDQFDQFEYVLASLVSLGKVTSDDLRPIMDKYRTSAGENGNIKTLAMKEEEEGVPLLVKSSC